MWTEYVRAGRLGLITEKESEISQVTPEEASAVSSCILNTETASNQS